MRERERERERERVRYVLTTEKSCLYNVTKLRIKLNTTFPITAVPVKTWQRFILLTMNVISA